MGALELLVLSAMFSGSLYVVWYWLMAPVPLHTLDGAELRRRLQLQPLPVREQILARGSLTRSQWAEMQALQPAARRALRRH